MRSPTLILASASPRRVELLRAAGFSFLIDPADIDEDDVSAGLAPEAVATYLARAKAMHVGGRHPPDRIVIGADTVVAIGDRLFGKAATPEEADAMLQAMAGQRQRVITGIAIVRDQRPVIVEAVVSEVDMRPMSDSERSAYVASEAWRGKAGAYGLQDQDPERDPFVRLVSGGFSNVVGLPIERVIECLAALNVRPMAGEDET